MSKLRLLSDTEIEHVTGGRGERGSEVVGNGVAGTLFVVAGGLFIAATSPAWVTAAGVGFVIVGGVHLWRALGVKLK
jgi:hypothetical protein